jgi:hypothetical protein
MQITMPETEYNLSVRETGNSRFNDLAVMCTLADVKHILRIPGARVSYYSDPSVYHHWGYLVIITAEGNDYRFTSRDYQLTETYLSA